MEPLDESENWRDWFEVHGPGLLLCARQWTQSAADAEDVLQEAFVRYWRHQRHLSGNPRALLIVSIRRAAFDHARGNLRRAAREEKSWSNIEGNVPLFESSSLEGVERSQAIELALERVPREQREVLVLKIWNELTFEQIAQTLDIPANTAASRYRYALAVLRRELKPIHHG